MILSYRRRNEQQSRLLLRSLYPSYMVELTCIDRWYDLKGPFLACAKMMVGSHRGLILRFEALHLSPCIHWKIFRSLLTVDWANVIWWNISSTARSLLLSLPGVLITFSLYSLSCQLSPPGLSLYCVRFFLFYFISFGFVFFKFFLGQLCSQQEVFRASYWPVFPDSVGTSGYFMSFF